MFWGSFSAKIDDKGRLKVPTAFRSVIEGRYGDLLFVTSLSGESVRLYPMPVWTAVEEKLSKVPSMLPALIRFVDRVSYYGQPANLDKQGRISIHGRLRESADMTGEVDVLGRNDYLEVWNHERLRSRMDKEPLTKDDLLALSSTGSDVGGRSEPQAGHEPVMAAEVMTLLEPGRGRAVRRLHRRRRRPRPGAARSRGRPSHRPRSGPGSAVDRGRTPPGLG